MLFFIIFMSVLSIAYGYVGWRIIVPANLSVYGNVLAWTTLVLLLILPPLPWFIRSGAIDRSAVTFLYWIGYIGLGFMTLLIFMILFRDLGILLFKATQKVYALVHSSAEANTSTDPQRRQFLIQSVNLGILGLTAAATGYGYFEARRRPRLVEIDVPIDNLPEEMEGFRIAQFSDLHIGPTIKRSFVETVVQTIKEAKPDLIAFTGDLVDGTVAELLDDVEPLRSLNAPYGKYFVTGNHEYYSGVFPWINKAKELGFQVLLNENKLLDINGGRLTLAGVTDYSAGPGNHNHVSDPWRAIDNAPADSIKVLMAHQPKNIHAAAKAGYDLQISGHTHGGQFIPWNFMTRLAQPYISGLNRHEKTWIYVNHGTGYWGPPLRLGVRSEITILRLARNTEKLPKNS